MSRLTIVEYSELRRNLYTLTGRFIDEQNFDAMRKVKAFSDWIDNLQEEERREEKCRMKESKCLCDSCRFSNEGICGIDAEPLEKIDPEGCIFYEIKRNAKTARKDDRA